MTALQKTAFLVVCIIAVVFIFVSIYFFVKSKQDKKILLKQIRELERRANRDYLTGLYNRQAFIERIDAILAKDGKGALLIFDVNGFKGVNDKYGHTVGDVVIINFAERLSKGFTDAIVGRLGGDEFIVFFEGELSRDDITDLCKKAEVTSYYDDSAKLKLTTSCGVAEAPKFGTSFEQLYKNADKAMYRSKKTKKRITFCDSTQSVQ